MSQDRDSGLQGNDFGRWAAKRIEEELGGKLLNRRQSNLLELGGKVGVVKSAGLRTIYVGITKKMLPKLDFALIVLEVRPDHFEVYRVSRKDLEAQKREPAGYSRETQWFIKRNAAKKHGALVTSFSKVPSRAYWVTTQWPHRQGTPKDAPREGVYLPDDRKEAGADIRPGDLVVVYESKGGRDLVRKDVSGKKETVKHHVGREGVVSILRITSRLYADDESEEQEYSDGTKIWWKWYADTEPYFSSGFLPRQELNVLLGYKIDNALRGFGDKHSGLKKIDRDTFLKIEEAFRCAGAFPGLKPERPTGKPHGGGKGEESDLHRSIKEVIANDPAGVLREPGLRTIKMEYPFPSADKADVLLEDGQGRVVGLEVELAVGDNDLAGILQAIKYRFMGALMEGRRYSDSRSILVATSISAKAREYCQAYEVEWVEIEPGSFRIKERGR